MNGYDYGNARVRGMKGRLLQREELERLLTQSDIEHLINALGDTTYRVDIEAALMSKQGVQCIELALQMNLNRTLRKLLNFYEGRERRLLKVHLDYWDVLNIKTILRGQESHTDPEAIINDLMPIDELNATLLRELAQCPDLKSVIDLLAVWGITYARPLTAAIPEYVGTRRLAVLETALDKFYYAHALKQSAGRDANARLVREITAREIDRINLITLLRLSTVPYAERRRWNITYGERPCTRFLIPGGLEISITPFTRLITCPDTDYVLEEIRGTSLYTALSKHLKEYRRSGQLSFLERCLEREMTRKVVKLFTSDPLSIAIPIAYIRAKVNEVTNIRIIARGLDLGVLPVEITKELIFV